MQTEDTGAGHAILRERWYPAARGRAWSPDPAGRETMHASVRIYRGLGGL